jgi:hypothetical protein
VQVAGRYLPYLGRLGIVEQTTDDGQREIARWAAVRPWRLQ